MSQPPSEESDQPPTDEYQFAALASAVPESERETVLRLLRVLADAAALVDAGACPCLDPAARAGSDPIH